MTILTEEKEGEKGKTPMTWEANGSSLLELQHLVFVLHNASTRNVTTGIFCPNFPEGSGEGVENRKKKKLIQNQGYTTEPALSKNYYTGIRLSWRWLLWGRVSLYLQSLRCFQAGGKCRNLFIRLYLDYSSYLTAWMLQCHFCMKYSGDYLVINSLIRTGDESSLAFHLRI